MKFLTLMLLSLFAISCSSPKERYEDRVSEAQEDYNEEVKQAQEDYKEEDLEAQKEEAQDMVEDADSVQVNDDENNIKVED